MNEHRITLVIEPISESGVERLLDGLNDVARHAGPVVDLEIGSERINVTLALDAEDATLATAHAGRLLAAALEAAGLHARPVLHAEAELVDEDAERAVA